jgi:hypothetical protein
VEENSVKMVCPICTVAVAAGIGILEKWGVDNIIIGIWVGALVVSSIAWMLDYLNRKNIHFIFKPQLIIISFYLIFVWPLYHWGIMGGANKIAFGISWLDRTLFGIIIGTFLFIGAVLYDNYLRKLNDNRIMIKYQRVIVPIVALIIASIIVFLLIGIFVV